MGLVIGGSELCPLEDATWKQQKNHPHTNRPPPPHPPNNHKKQTTPPFGIQTPLDQACRRRRIELQEKSQAPRVGPGNGNANSEQRGQGGRTVALGKHASPSSLSRDFVWRKRQGEERNKRTFPKKRGGQECKEKEEGPR